MSYHNDSGDMMRVSPGSKFRTVLKVKRIQERKAQTELHQLQRAHAEEEATLADKRETQKAAISEAVRSMKVKATDAQTSRAFLKKLSREIDEQTRKVEELQSRREEKRGELIERTKSTAVVEKLDDKLRLEAVKENERKEQRLIDVLAQRIKTEDK